MFKQAQESLVSAGNSVSQGTGPAMVTAPGHRSTLHHSKQSVSTSFSVDPALAQLSRALTETLSGCDQGIQSLQELAKLCQENSNYKSIDFSKHEETRGLAYLHHGKMLVMYLMFITQNDTNTAQVRSSAILQARQSLKLALECLRTESERAEVYSYLEKLDTLA